MNRIKTFNSFYKLILAVGVVASILFFLGPTYDDDVHETETHLSANALCETQNPPRPPRAPAECPRGGIVTVQQGGRLGNQIWEYASVWAMSRTTGLSPYVPGCILDTLDDLFDSLSVPALEDISHCPLPKNQTLVLPIYSRLFEQTLPHLGPIREEFRLRRDLVQRCQRVLRAASRLSPRSTHTFVAVHVRRTDYAAYLRRKYGDPDIKTADAGYFRRAMGVFERAFEDVVFVVLSDDLSWCRKEFSGRANVYLSMRRRSAVMDLALMASCNHTIYDYGTYGDWGSLLAGGDTIYFDLGVNPSAQMGKLIPNWRTV